MDFVLSPEQETLRDTVRTFLVKKWPESAVRQALESDAAFDADLWHQVCDQLGLVGLALPEEFGGSGYGPVEQVVVLEEMGRALFSGPYFSTVVLAAGALLACAEAPAQKEFLPRIAAGELTATLAITEPNAGWEPEAVTMTATTSGDSWTLTGTKDLVVDGSTAGLVLVVARTDAGLSLFSVDGDDATLTRTPLDAMDGTRKLARLEFASTPAQLVSADGAAGPGLVEVLDFAAIAVAAEQVGGAAKCLDLSVEHAKNREQFGKQVGTFQAVKHKCSDMRLRLDTARAAVHYAGWAASEHTDDVHLLSAVVKAYCSTAFSATAADTIQVHGGIGFTWEHPAHLYFKRAKSSELFLGSPAQQRRRIAETLLP